MTPKEYEQYIARLYQKKGYETTVTPYSNDWGIDVIAIKGDEKIAIQAKMYGNSRKVNRSTIMQLHGAMAFQKCTKAVLATDGELLDDAIEVAQKLNIEIVYTKKDVVASSINKEEEANVPVPTNWDKNYPTFDEAWQKHVVPLKGKTLINSRGTNKILDVNTAGITRITSNGKKGSIDIEGFRFAYNQLIKRGWVSRDEINQEIDKRCSSGIVLVLSQIPFVSVLENPKRLKLK